jgi:hypothetical protein
MESLTAIEWDVLNATADDPENLEQIYQSIRRHAASPVLLADVADAIRTLLDGGLLVARDEQGRQVDDVSDSMPLWREWFSMSDRGREVWATSSPARRPEPAARRSLFGVWKDLGIHLTLDDVSEARREMWEGFPRDFPK